MKKLISAFSLLAVCLTMLAVPAKQGVYKTLKLNDGTEVQAMLVGDEFAHFWRSNDGKTYVQNGDVYEEVDAQSLIEPAKARRAKRDAALGKRLPHKTVGHIGHYKGKKRGLIILVEFQDVKFQSGHNKAFYQRMANEKGFHEGNAMGSIADYFRAQSFGQFELEFDVVGPLTLSHEVAYYSVKNARAPEITIEAIEQLKRQEIDWKQYDWDGNGEVDQVYLIYAGQSAHDTGNNNLIWPGAWYLEWAKELNGIGSGPIEVAPNLKVNTYAYGNELTRDFRLCGIGVMCHEFSHCLGYPDFYDTDYSGGQGMGNWDLMDSGANIDDANHPAGYTSYERWVVGWLEPTVLEDEDVCVKNMKSLQSSGECYVIYNKGNRDEYYLLENRQHDGWDVAIPGTGLLIIHVDYDSTAWVKNKPNDDPRHQRMTVVPADGEFRHDEKLNYYQSNYDTDAFPQGSVNAFNKLYKPFDYQAYHAAMLWNKNIDDSYWIDSSVEAINQHSDGTLSFNFVAQYKEPKLKDKPVVEGRFDYEEVKEIHPTGWLQTMLQRQHDGLTGHPEALSYPYNSCLWAGEISRPDESYGDNWWRYEQTAYYTEGLLKLGYELGDEKMIAKAMEGIEYTLAHPDENGVLGNSTLVGITWPMSVFFRVLQAKYEHDGDERIPKALERHYLNFTPEELAGGIVGGRNIMSLEGILWTYGRTGNQKLIQLAEEAWAIQDKFAVDETAIRSYEPFYMHAVTFSEMLKLPILLYEYTANTKYLDLAEIAAQKVERESMLPDGVPSSAEFLYGSSIDVSHETCVIVDYTWTLSHYLRVTGDATWADKIEKAIYNAGMGAITKDFKSLQYFSSVNQFIATGNSNHNIYKHGSTWMAYRPTHETECCSGNVNRMLPNFVSRMWMTDPVGGAVATIYGPSQATFETDKGDVTIQCVTKYPFSEVLTFKVSANDDASIPLTLRIPEWCNEASISVNGSPVDMIVNAGTFVKLPVAVKNNDVVTLTLPMETKVMVRKGQGVCFLRGPLLYSYAIPQQMTEDTEEYANMHGKKSENPDFKCWNITPTGAFNYAYYYDRIMPELIYPNIEEIDGKIPFDLGYAPVNLRIKALPIEWDLVEGRYTPPTPVQGKLHFLSDKTQELDLVPYGCTELRLTIFPWANADPLPEPEEPDYTRPADAPKCVEAVDGVYYAYFEEPRFCWDEPIYCKVRTADDTTTDLHSNQGGDLCEIVGTTATGRKIWRWTGASTTEKPPVELIFTNHDLLTEAMPFLNGGYYDYLGPFFIADATTAIREVNPSPTLRPANGAIYNLSGQRISALKKGVYIVEGKKRVVQ